MDLLLINAVPFLMAVLFGFQATNRLLSKNVRTALASIVMAVLFITIASYIPQVQEIDLAFREQQGIALEETSDAAADTPATETATTESDDAENDADATATEAEATEIVTNNALIRSITWVPELGLSLSFYLDGLSLLFSLIVTGIGAGIFLYAGFYFEDEEDQSRFFAILYAFAGAMLGLVLSGNLLTMFVMWELTSITSFLLIGFKGSKYESARFGAMQAFSVTGIGALGLIAGVVVLAYITGDVVNGSGFIFDIAQILQADPMAVGAHPLYAGALILIAFGAFTKSAQFPFHFWLPGAMSAPTPASAYLHSATMVKAGVYLLLRLYPAMNENELWTSLLVLFGIGTMLIGAAISIFQRDLKGLLAYATVSWLGALVGMIGLPDSIGLKAAYVGIIAHALYKAALFLAAGSIDHNTGTRIIDKLGGLRKQMPGMAVVVTISALSMAGLPFLFGFVAKEVLLKDWLDAAFVGQQIAYYAIIVAAALTGTAGYIFVWDVFFKEPTEEVHYHAAPRLMSLTPVLLAVGTVTFGLLIDPPVTIVEDLIQLGIPKPIDVPLLPPSMFDPVFLTSLAIVVGGFVVFLLRNFWLPVLSNIPLPRATDVYKAVVASVDWMGDQVTRTQNGRIRYYLVTILGTVAAVIFASGITDALAAGRNVLADPVDFDAATALRVILLLLAIVASFTTVIFRSHLTAALGLGVLGYAVGGLFLLEPAPDVAMVQFLIETLATVLIVVMLGRISTKRRRDAMSKIWKGRSMVGDVNVGIFRDLIIAGAIGLGVFFFSLTAIANRPERETIAEYHLANTFDQLGVQDVVGAIVADYRGMDTVIEVAVFATAALGVLTLLTRGLSEMGPFTPTQSMLKKQHEFDEDTVEDLRMTTNLNTPFTRFVARMVLPLAFVFGISNIVNGGNGPGDGFTAGAIAGLATALWFVIFGYDEASQRLGFFAPHRLMRAGLVVVVINSTLPILLGINGGAFHVFVDYGALLGIDGLLDIFALKFTSSLVFEIGIALTVFGGVGSIVESIAQPSTALNFDADDH